MNFRYIKLCAFALAFVGFAQTTQAQTKAPNTATPSVQDEETPALAIPADAQLLSKEELAEMDPNMSYEEYLRTERQPISNFMKRTEEVDPMTEEQRTSVKKAVPMKSQDDDGANQ